jgi:hypothetical protein
LSKALLRLERAEPGCLLVPIARHRRIGSDAPRIWRPKHGWVVGLGQEEGSAGLLRVRCPFEQQSGSRDVAYRDHALCPLQQRCEFVGFDTPRLRSSRWWLTDFRHALVGDPKRSSDFVARPRFRNYLDFIGAGRFF